MGKHEMTGEHGTSDESDVPGLHEKHRNVRLAVKDAWRVIRDVSIAVVGAGTFEWIRVMSPVLPASHHSEAFAAHVAMVVSHVGF